MAGTTPVTLLKDTLVLTGSSICPFRLTNSHFITFNLKLSLIKIKIKKLPLNYELQNVFHQSFLRYSLFNSTNGHIVG